MTLLFILWSHWCQSTFHEAIEYENAISEQVKSDLNAILPDESFVVIPSVKLNRSRTKVLAHSESYKSSQLDGEPQAPRLPGFDDGPQDSPPGPKEIQKRSYEFKEDLKVSSILIKVLVEKTLPEELYQLAQKTIRSKIQASYGKKAKVRFEQSDIFAAKSRFRSSTEFKKWTASMSSNWPIFLGAFISLLLFFSGLYFVLRLMARRPIPAREYREEPEYREALPARAREVSSEPDVEEPKLLENTSSPESQRLYESHLDELIGNLTTHTNVSRSFIEHQKPEAIESLISTIDNPSLIKPLRSLFPDSTNWEKQEESHRDIDEKNSILAQFNKDLEKYRRVYQFQSKQKFGFFTTMSPEEVAKVLARCNARETVSVCRLLDKDFAGRIMSKFPSERKKDLAIALSSPPLDGEELVALEDKLRTRCTEKEGFYLVDRKQDDVFLETIIESEANPKSLIDQLIPLDESMATRFQTYSVTFDQLVSNFPEDFSHAIDQIENETLAYAIIKFADNDKQNIYTFLPESRRKIIESLQVSLDGSANEELVNQSQQQILRSYRSSHKRAS